MNNQHKHTQVSLLPLDLFARPSWEVLFSRTFRSLFLKVVSELPESRAYPRTPPSGSSPSRSVWGWPPPPRLARDICLYWHSDPCGKGAPPARMIRLAGVPPWFSNFTTCSPGCFVWTMPGSPHCYIGHAGPEWRYGNGPFQNVVQLFLKCSSIT